MTDETETIQDRVARTESEDMDVTLVDTDPLVAQVYNHESDRIHTVIPDSVHCSCEDHTYRGTICKHLLELMQYDSSLGSITREAVKDHRNDLEHQSCELRDEVERIEGEIDEIVAALNAVDADHYREAAVSDVVDAFESYNPDEGGATIDMDVDDDADDTDAERPNNTEFSEMVHEMTGDGE